MQVAIAGAGAVGRSIARELLGNDHDVLLIDKDPAQDRRHGPRRRAPSGCSATPARWPTSRTPSSRSTTW